MNTKWILAAVLVIGAAAFLARRSMAGEELEDDMPDQTAGMLEGLYNDFTEDDVSDSISTNEKAFLDMIAFSEGTANGADGGYGVLFGGGSFSDYSDHPRQLFSFTNKAGQQLKTTAAGRYQFLSRTWDELKGKLDLPDFGPHSQDLAALELIRGKGALDDVRAGRTTTAINKVAKVWASLPGAGYDQTERKLSSLLAAFSANGGTTTEA